MAAPREELLGILRMATVALATGKRVIRESEALGREVLAPPQATATTRSLLHGDGAVSGWVTPRVGTGGGGLPCRLGSDGATCRQIPPPLRKGLVQVRPPARSEIAGELLLRPC